MPVGLPSLSGYLRDSAPSAFVSRRGPCPFGGPRCRGLSPV